MFSSHYKRYQKSFLIQLEDWHTYVVIESINIPQITAPENMVLSRLILFDLILYVPSTIFQLNRDGSSWVEPVLS